MERPGQGSSKFNLVIRAICIWNTIAFFLSVGILTLGWRASLVEGQKIPWAGMLVIVGILLMFAYSTVGLWFRRTWALVVQLIIYLLQLFAIQTSTFKFDPNLGFKYMLTFTLNLGGDSALVGVNIVAVVILTLLFLTWSEFSARRV